jgi:hypothetical protein
MMFGDYVLQGGKFAGCLPEDVPLADLKFESSRGCSTVLDRLALQERYRALLPQRKRAALHPRAGYPLSGNGNATAGAGARTAGYSSPHQIGVK